MRALGLSFENTELFLFGGENAALCIKVSMTLLQVDGSFYAIDLA
ncbi:hypothetical protein [Pelagicoccus sp. SDUM812002]|nr:hypothetical protein [Pelagicoccus sp. SDUM812002]MDQ8186794.1 hypothetical protein [Pelagicoccus sp. SDUM812002]